MLNEENAAVFYLSKSNDDLYYLNEFISLARNAGYKVIEKYSQKLDKPDKHTFFGSGKIMEIREIIRNNDEKTDNYPSFDYVLVNDDINPLQKKIMEDILEMPVIDRSTIILKIFEDNAKSKEAKLQVEIAKLRYTSNQLVDAMASYSQVTSGTGRNKGEGEKAIELSKRQIENKIVAKKRELETIKLSRRISRAKRNKSPIPKVAVVGYTNAGKSSLINALLSYQHSHPNKTVLVKDDVFATLQTSTRLINCYGYPAFYITDTVGFVSRLPIYLIEAFRSTLEEIKEADLIVKVVDFSDSHYEEHIQTTADVLSQLGVENVPTLFLYNKYDQVAGTPTTLPKENELYSCLLPNESNISEIIKFISQNIAKKWKRKNIVFPFEKDFSAFMFDNYVQKFKEKEDGYHCTAYFNPLSIYKYDYLFKPRD
ncbi:MAG: GTPase HflX [Erysipelotrichaceae bacterium]|nr:GTPase HflX [Erysipelotrichaceae bacterium]